MGRTIFAFFAGAAALYAALIIVGVYYVKPQPVAQASLNGEEVVCYAVDPD